VIWIILYTVHKKYFPLNVSHLQLVTTVGCKVYVIRVKMKSFMSKMHIPISLVFQGNKNNKYPLLFLIVRISMM